MTILAAIRREERKLEKQLGKLQHQLGGVRAAAKALVGSANRELAGVKKRVLSAAGRAKIAAAARRCWARVRAKARKMAASIAREKGSPSLSRSLEARWTYCGQIRCQAPGRWP
jgi:hypothetical protein